MAVSDSCTAACSSSDSLLPGAPAASQKTTRNVNARTPGFIVPVTRLAYSVKTILVTADGLRPAADD
jgi:hypothetical protein